MPSVRLGRLSIFLAYSTAIVGSPRQRDVYALAANTDTSKPSASTSVKGIEGRHWGKGDGALNVSTRVETPETVCSIAF